MSVVTSRFKYKKIKKVGAGCFGEVWLIDDQQLLGRFAAKEIPKARLTGTAFSELFAEAQKMHASNCPHVVPVRAAGQNKDCISIIMPYFQRGSLADRITSVPLSPRESIRITLDLMLGLASIHRANVIHFDLKPSNVLFDNHDRAMLADFGQAQRLTASGLAAVPDMYQWCRPPEVLTSFVGTQQSDIFQAGLTMYRMVNGEPFYRKQSSLFPVASAVDQARLEKAISRGKFPDRKLFMPHVSPGLRRIIKKALSVDPSKRFHNANQFSDALTKLSVEMDWKVTDSGGGSVTWRADPPDRASVIVELIKSGHAFSVEVFTDSTGRRRKKNRDQLHRKNLTEPAVQAHLESIVFPQLG